MRYAHGALAGLVLGMVGVAAYSAPTRTPPSTTAMPPSATTHCPPASTPPNTRAPYAATSDAMPRNPDAHTNPEQPMKPQAPSPNPPPCG